MTRPHFSRRIDELEALYEDNDHDLGILRELLDELNHRSTQRAGKLRELIQHRINHLENNAPAPAGSRKVKATAPGISSIQPKIEEFENPSTLEPLPNLEDNFWEQPIDALQASTSQPEEPAELDNEPSSILDAWFALEVLSPQSFSRPADLADGDYRRVVKLNKGLPWTDGPEKARPNTKLFYHIVLGAIRLDLATADLLRAFGDRRPERPRTQDNAALAIVTVDKLGRPAGDNPVAISSFGFGYQKACQGEFDALKQWREVEDKITASLSQFLVRYSDDGQEILPVTMEQILKASRWLAAGFRIPDSHYIKPEFGIRAYQWFLAPNPPEPLLLNSFFLSDLSAAAATVASDLAGTALRRYLGMEKPERQIDLLSDTEELEQLVSPASTPLARWPAAGRHSLVLLQQAAVNLAFAELEQDGLMGVNGPPGTGKTTLLRDIVAGVVANRAEVLCTYDDPETAFCHAGQLRNGRSFSHLYQIDEALLGHEILVASANNKAVENISREIPEAKHVEHSQAPDYYASIADNVNGEEGSCWGIAAAVMGNAANRVAFYQKFWKDPNRGMRQYLWACQGNDATVTRTDPETGEEFEEEAEVVRREAPPLGRSDAMEWWKKTRREYQHIAKGTERTINDLERFRQLVSESRDLAKSHVRCVAEVDETTFETSKALSVFQDSVQQLSELQATDSAANIDLADHNERKPPFLSRVFRSAPWTQWKSENRRFTDAAKLSRSRLVKQKRVCEEANGSLETAKARKTDAQKSLDDVVAQRELTEMALAKARSALGSVFAGDSFWAQEHDNLQLSVAWLDDKTQDLRDRLFAEAFELHKAFIAAAAKPIRNNLKTLFGVILGSGLDETKRQHLPSLWATLFLVVPVVSTTFASVGRMLKPMPPESIGWLLIDEAGQASPQMAIGAIMRAKRACVVGDPLQIEPVVTLSNQLVERLARKFGVDSDEWMAPMSSVQELADRASNYATWIERPDGLVRVGAPLLVHRRCVEPMFSISNAISYANLMVQATKPRDSEIRMITGESRWIDVQGSSRFKWSPEEGEKVVEILTALVNAGNENPDIFVISPFRNVMQGVRNRLRSERALLDRLSSQESNWLYDRVGTVHTFQGKQAEAVVLVLGAQGPDEVFARRWAGNPPNLINVAVSRAKSVLYVVGNRQLWRDVGALAQVSSRLS